MKLFVIHLDKNFIQYGNDKLDGFVTWFYLRLYLGFIFETRNGMGGIHVTIYRVINCLTFCKAFVQECNRHFDKLFKANESKIPSKIL